jgi:hypothetical protein
MNFLTNLQISKINKPINIPECSSNLQISKSPILSLSIYILYHPLIFIILAPEFSHKSSNLFDKLLGHSCEYWIIFTVLSDLVWFCLVVSDLLILTNLQLLKFPFYVIPNSFKWSHQILLIFPPYFHFRIPFLSSNPLDFRILLILQIFLIYISSNLYYFASFIKPDQSCSIFSILFEIYMNL